MIGPHKVPDLSPAPIRDHKQARLQADQEKKSADFALRSKLQSHYDQQVATVGALRLPTPHPLIVDELPILSPEHNQTKQTDTKNHEQYQHQHRPQIDRPEEIETHDPAERTGSGLLDLIMIPTPESPYGEYMIKQRSTKEEVEGKVQTPILGNAKTAVKWEGQ